jgi:flagellar basal body-associated protein FliL
VKELKGRNYFLYILVVFNILFGLIIFYFQGKQFKKPREFLPPPEVSQGLGLKAIIKIPKIHTNLLTSNNLKRYWRMAPVLILEKEQVLDEIKIKETIIREKIMYYVNNLPEEKVFSEKGMELVKENTKEIINRILTKNKVLMIYFLEFRVN